MEILSLIMLAVTAGTFLLVAWVAPRGFFSSSTSCQSNERWQPHRSSIFATINAASPRLREHFLDGSSWRWSQKAIRLSLLLLFIISHLFDRAEVENCARWLHSKRRRLARMLATHQPYARKRKGPDWRNLDRALLLTRVSGTDRCTGSPKSVRNRRWAAVFYLGERYLDHNLRAWNSADHCAANRMITTSNRH